MSKKLVEGLVVGATLTAAFVGVTPLRAAESARILISSDAGCDLKIDGEPVGRVEADEDRPFPASAGKHLVKALCTGGHRFEKSWRSWQRASRWC